jgi:hypothetical protein
MDKRRKTPNLSVQQKLELPEELEAGVSVPPVCDEYEYGYLDLPDTRQHWTSPPPNESVKSRIYCIISYAVITIKYVEIVDV